VLITSTGGRLAIGCGDVEITGEQSAMVDNTRFVPMPFIGIRHNSV